MGARGLLWRSHGCWCPALHTGRPGHCDSHRYQSYVVPGDSQASRVRYPFLSSCPLAPQALQAVTDLANTPELHLEWDLRPGDIQLLHNWNQVGFRLPSHRLPQGGRGGDSGCGREHRAHIGRRPPLVHACGAIYILIDLESIESS